MREIKFRVYVKEDEHSCEAMHFVDLKDEVAEYDCRVMQEFPLMQYTGLKDKNGKEIYEGDIVKMCLRNGTNIDDGIIEFGLHCSFHIAYFGKSGQYCFIQGEGTGSSSDDLKSLDEYNEIDCNDLIVIGNIYEHPSLLETNK